MAILLPVPWITQLAAGHEDPTGCWYASACMVGFFFEAGPRLGLPRLYSRPLSDGRLGHHATGSAGATQANPNHHSDLARHENFEAVPDCRTSHVYSLSDIEGFLKNHGPVFMYWFKASGAPVPRNARTPETYGHASVIVGTSDAGLIFHDPEYRAEKDGANRSMTLDNFNAARQCWQWALMRRAGATAAMVEAAIRARA